MNELISRMELAQLREDYPKGAVVVLDKMDDPYRNIPAGTRGVVQFVDDAGTVHVLWDVGFRLGLVYRVDEYHLFEKEGES